MKQGRDRRAGVECVAAAVFLAAAAAVAGPSESPTPVSPGVSLHAFLPKGSPETTFIAYALGPGVKGPVTIEAKSWDVDMELRVFSVDPAGSLTSLATDDDSGIGSNSLILLDADPQTRYRIEVHPMVEEWGGECEVSVTAGRTRLPVGDALRQAEEAWRMAAIERSHEVHNPLREARILEILGTQLIQAGSYNEAITVLRQAIAVRDTVAGTEDHHADLLVAIAQTQQRAGSLEEARTTFGQAVAFSEQTFGVGDPRLVPVLSAYGDFLVETDDKAGALAMFTRAAALGRASKDWHSAAVLQLRKIAYAQDDLGRTEAAEQGFREAIGAAMELIGPESKEAAVALFSLTHFYERHGRLEEALESNARSLSINEKTSGPEHIDVAYNLVEQGRLQYGLEKSAAAEESFKRAIRICEKNPSLNDGWEHRGICAEIFADLGELYRREARFKEAAPLLERAVLKMKEATTPDEVILNTVFRRSDLLSRSEGLRRLGRLYQSLGRYQEGEPLLRRVLAMREEGLPSDHWAVAQSLEDLGDNLHYLGRAQEAVPLLERALAIREKQDGPESANVASALILLCAPLRDLHRVEDAEVGLLRALHIREKKVPGTAAYAVAMNELALVYLDLNRFADAEPLFRRSLEIDENVHGPMHPETATALVNLGVTLADLRRYDEAEPLELRALTIRRKVFGADAPDVAHSLMNLGALNRSMKKYTKAESFFRQALVMYEKTLDPSHPAIRECRGRLVSFLKERHRDEEAAALLAQAARSATTPSPAVSTP